MSRAKGAAAALALLGVVGCGESRGTLVTTDGGALGTPWRPAPASSWQVQLSGALDTSIDVAIYDVDLDTAASTLASLHAAGRRVICYVSAGTYEPWRDDASAFPAVTRGLEVAGYPNESWLDTRDATVRALMAARLDVAAQKGCDGVDLSNVSPGGADTGFPIGTAEALDYAAFLTAEAHRRGLGAGLGGGADIAAAAQPLFEWAFADTCLAAGSCGAFSGFVAARKAVFAVAFGTEADAPTVCPAARAQGLDALIKNRSLDAFRVACP
jgi:hypothetical protein